MLLLVASIVIVSSFFFASRAFAGVQPPQDPGEPSGETASANEWKRKEEKLIFLGLHRKPIKSQDKGLALFTEPAGALPVSPGSEDAQRLPVQVLEAQAGKWTQRASMLQGISLKKRVRERERKKERKKRKTRGNQAFVELVLICHFIFQGCFYTLTCT